MLIGYQTRSGNTLANPYLQMLPTMSLEDIEEFLNGINNFNVTVSTTATITAAVGATTVASTAASSAAPEKLAGNLDVETSATATSRNLPNGSVADQVRHMADRTQGHAD